jgi:hypothetical protein
MENPEERRSKLKQAADEAKRRHELAQKRREEARIAINTAGENANVRIILRYLCEISGFKENPIVVQRMTGEANQGSTEYNVGRQSVFHDFCKLMSAETEILILKREE